MKHRRCSKKYSYSIRWVLVLFAFHALLPCQSFLPSSRRIPATQRSLLHRSSIAAVLLDEESQQQDDKIAGAEEDSTQQLIETGRRELERFFAFPLDDWQLQAGGAIWDGYNVVVCSPTGSGKTVVGEMALHIAFEQKGKSGIYTTPLKALSNQKFTELSAIFGRNNTGLSTGDVSINKGARLTVMTTEVYRNIAWRSSTHTATLMRKNELTENAVVVLDEFHYMGHPGRGGVWEECIITSPAHTQIVGLSATLSNAQALSSWMESVTGRKTILVEVPANERPVPLRYLFATKEGLYPLFRDPDAGPGAPKGMLGYRGDGVATLESPQNKTKKRGGKPGFAVATNEDDTVQKLPRGLQINPALRNAAARRQQRVDRAIERQKVRRRLGSLDYDDEWGEPSPRRQVYQSAKKLSVREERKERERLLKKEMRRAVPSLHAVMNRLDQKDLLPAIFFIFSRAGCDEAARTMYRYLQGPRDPNRIVQDEVAEFSDKRPDEKQQRKRKSRQRGSRRRDLLQDSEGRMFRAGSNFVSDEVISSALYEGTGSLLGENDFDHSSPLAAENWNYYAKAGLLSYNEIREVASRISMFNDENKEIAFEDDLVEQYLFGIGSHHAGMLPAHKSFVEVLFRKQLMKVVCATETLAAGINMPCRTTVICALAKRGGNSGSMKLLETSNLLQMAGRAGRRSMDLSGTCVLVASPFESHDDAAAILTEPIKPISSQFSPSYSLCVNLIDRGEGQLATAKQLVSKSFAMWEKNQMESNIAEAIESHGEGVREVIQTSAQEKFMNALVDTLQSLVDRRSANLDIGRIQSLLPILNDRTLLKKTSKSFIGAIKMLELERTTLGYLEREYSALREVSFEEDSDIIGEILNEDEQGILEQIDLQKKRALSTELEVRKHPFSVLADITNTIMKETTPEGTLLSGALKAARLGEENAGSASLSAEELSLFSKSAIVMRRKTRKLAKANPSLDADSLLVQADKADIATDDSWSDFLSITKTLIAYGCLSTKSPFSEDLDLEAETFELTFSGVNLGMLGFENSLWVVVAMGGASDVVGASAELDEFRASMQSFDEDDGDWYEDVEAAQSDALPIPKPQQEADELLALLRSMTPCELAGYVSSLISEGSRGGGLTVVELFQRITPLQQRVVQKSLLSLERLAEVQKRYSVDENTRNCNLDISNCEVVTAWADGCTWSDALRLSGSPPGDLARNLSRALDAVRQLGNLPFAPVRRKDLESATETEIVSRGLDPQVRRLCREAAKAINRYPVKDPLAFETPVDELFSEEEGIADEDVADVESDEAIDGETPS